MAYPRGSGIASKVITRAASEDTDLVIDPPGMYIYPMSDGNVKFLDGSNNEVTVTMFRSAGPLWAEVKKIFDSGTSLSVAIGIE